MLLGTKAQKTESVLKPVPNSFYFEPKKAKIERTASPLRWGPAFASLGSLACARQQASFTAKRERQGVFFSREDIKKRPLLPEISGEADAFVFSEKR